MGSKIADDIDRHAGHILDRASRILDICQRNRSYRQSVQMVLETLSVELKEMGERAGKLDNIDKRVACSE